MIAAATTQPVRFAVRLLVALSLILAGWSSPAPAAAEPRRSTAPPVPGDAHPPDRRKPPSDDGQARLRALMVPGGLTADEVARLAVASSPELHGRQAATDTAAARGSQASAEFWPRVSLSARYTRLSPIEAPVFPVFLNNYAVGGSLSVPVSDYLLRTSRSLRAARDGTAAAKLDADATRRKVVADARLAYYDWIRARGQLLVVEQRAESAQAQVADAGRLFDAGAVSRADVLAARAQAKSVELALVRARQQVELTTTRLRVVMHDDRATYQIGEDLLAPLPPVPDANDVPRLIDEAHATRPELAGLRETEAAMGELAKLAGNARWPRLELVASVTHANPNPRIFPAKQEWHTTWDAGVVLSYSPTDLPLVSGRVREQQGRAREVAAQRAALLDALRIEVQEAAGAVNAATAAVEAAGQGLLSAEEAYRVRRDLYLAGKATALEVTSAETDLMTARLQVVDANVEARQARVRLVRAVGRDGSP